MNTSSSSLLSRARRLGAGALVALTPLAASAVTLTLDYSGSAEYSSSGFFTGSFDESKATGAILNSGQGFKLSGSDSRTDSMFWQYDSYSGRTVPRSSVSGLAFVWGGQILGATSSADTLSTPYEFSFSFTQNDPNTPQYVYNNLTIGYREQAYTPEAYSTLPNSGSGNYNNAYESYYTAGAYDRSGILSTHLTDSDGTQPLYWYAILTFEWPSEYAGGYYWQDGDYHKLNGDILSATIPDHSIDVTFSPYIAPQPPTSNTVPDAGSTFGLLTLALGAIALRRRHSR